MKPPKTLFLKKLGLLDSVYEPREDSFLLMDALEAHLLPLPQPFTLLEVGCGSGAVSAFCSQLLADCEGCFTCTDVNEEALKATRLVWQENACRHPLRLQLCDLAEGVRQELRRKCHCILFNPPYVVSDPLEQEVQRFGPAALAWAGGERGMEVTDRLLAYVAELLAPSGRFFMVALKENDVDEILHRMREQHGLQGEVLMQRRCSNELLFILCFVAPPEE